MFKNTIKNLINKFFSISGNLSDLLGNYSRSVYKYNYGSADFVRLCTETYNRSTDFQEAIDLFSRGCADLPLCMAYRDKKTDIPENIQSFMKNPTKEQLVWSSFIKACFVNYFIGGEIFLLKDKDTKSVILIRPDEVSNIKVVDGVPWEYTISQSFFERNRFLNFEEKEHIFQSELKDGLWVSQVAHFFNRNPLFVERGLSIVVSLINDIEILFKGRTWNRSMIENEGRPSGVFYYPPNTTQGARPHSPLKGRAKVEEEIKSFYGGGVNAGKALFLKGGMQFQEVTYKMVDMDFLNGLQFSRESIANRLGIPLQMFGSEKSSTYNNMREARYGFYENTCVPFMNQFLHFFSLHILNDFFGEIRPEQTICIDRTKLYQKSPVFLDRITNLQAHYFLTPNEKREMLGLKRLEEDNMDMPMVPSNLVPIEDAGLIDNDSDDFDNEKKEDKKNDKKRYEI